MKLLFIFTGGTIGSTTENQSISPDPKKPYRILETYQKRYGIDFAYETVEPYCALSENNMGGRMSALIGAVTANLASDYDGIVVTHGTDTLQYSAAALGYACGNDCVPIALVSANYPLEHPMSNGLSNLHGAISRIRSGGIKGVFVPYQNPGEAVKIHRATRLNNSLPFSDRNESVCGMHMGEYDKDWRFCPNAEFGERQDEAEPFGALCLSEQADGILRVLPYPGMTYPSLSEQIRYVLHDSYHSGTVNTESQSAIRFFEQAKEKRIPVFLTGVGTGASYESTTAYEPLAIRPLHGISPISAYVKLWMLSASGRDPVLWMQRALGGDQ